MRLSGAPSIALVRVPEPPDWRGGGGTAKTRRTLSAVRSKVESATDLLTAEPVTLIYVTLPAFVPLPIPTIRRAGSTTGSWVATRTASRSGYSWYARSNLSASSFGPSWVQSSTTAWALLKAPLAQSGEDVPLPATIANTLAVRANLSVDVPRLGRSGRESGQTKDEEVQLPRGSAVSEIA